MNKFKRITLTIASACIILLSGCKKEETEPIIGTWQKSKVEQKTNNGSWTTSTRSCQLNDTEEYASGGKWTSYDGPNQCSAGSGIISGSWRLDAGGSKVVYTYSGFSGEYESTVEQLDGNTLILVHAVGDINNSQIRTTYTKK